MKLCEQIDSDGRNEWRNADYMVATVSYRIATLYSTRPLPPRTKTHKVTRERLRFGRAHHVLPFRCAMHHKFGDRFGRKVFVRHHATHDTMDSCTYLVGAREGFSSILFSRRGGYEPRPR